MPSPNSKQIINHYSRHQHFQSNPEAAQFVATHLQQAKSFEIDAEVIQFANEQVTIDGFFLEMGVCTGRTINFIAGLNPRKIIYGFDSFEGLPEAWKRDDVIVPKGAFGAKKQSYRPSVLNNVELVVGEFKKSLPDFRKEILKNSPVSFLHVDCDIYSSAHEVLTQLKNNIKKGTIILFDELYNYPGFEYHEWKALTTFLRDSGFHADFLAFNVYVGQVVVRIY